MNDVFSAVLNMSLVASLLIGAVFILRLVFRKAPKAIICILWALVGIRLICPFTVESMVSMVPTAKPAAQISDYATEAIYQNIASDFSAGGDKGELVVKTLKTMSVMDTVKKLVPYIWLAGVLVMVLSALISYIRLRRQVAVNVKLEGNIRLCDDIKSPFILGLLRPCIYVPSNLSRQELDVVLAHEKAHLKRCDHLWKPLGYLILCVHWFNPLVWIAYSLLCKDIEGACDQYVIKNMSISDKKLYSETLLGCSAPRHLLTACPVAFGEVGVKQRVKSVLSYKKPAFWIIIALVVVSLLVSVVLMTNPKSFYSQKGETISDFISRVILEEKENDLTKLYYPCESHTVLASEDIGDMSVYYLWVVYGEYSVEDYRVVKNGIGSSTPIVITVRNLSDSRYELVEYWEPGDGTEYAKDIREKFPQELQERVRLGVSYTQDLVKDCDKKAGEHFGISTLYSDVTEYPRFSAEVLEIFSDKLLVSPVDGEKIFGESYAELYINRNTLGGDIQFTKGDVIMITYADGIEESDPPILGNIEAISMMKKSYESCVSYDVYFLREYSADDNTKVYAQVLADEEKQDDLRIYRYQADSSTDDVKVSGGVSYVQEDFMPYIVLDDASGSATFRYGKNTSLTGKFEEGDDALIIKGAISDTLNSGQYTENMMCYFEKTDDGYMFNQKSSDHFENYGVNTDALIPHDALFEDGFVIIGAEDDLVHQ